MRGTKPRDGVSAIAARSLASAAVLIALVAASLASVSVTTEQASARGPAYAGPQTEADGPAYFGPAPNPLPYCDKPTYFDPWEENLNPVGRFDVGDTAAVSTDGMTLSLELVAEGNPDTQYPGFFPFDGEGIANDRAKGIEMAEGDSAVITLSQPLFYSQWVFTDVDQPGEGFAVEPLWAVIGEVIAYGGDNQFTFDATTRDRIVMDDVDGVGHDSEDVAGRAQVDLLGAVDGVTITRTSPSQGQSGAAVAGGCEASGAAKTVVSGPTWNGSSFDVTYELRLRNNLPTAQTILDVAAAAQANAKSTFSTAPPTSIDLEDLRLTDQLADPAFANITVTNVLTTSPGLVLNTGYDGIATDDLLLAGSALSAETEALITLEVQYEPDLTRADWVQCSTGYDYLNQSVISGTAGGIAVTDESDDGVDPSPSSENGSGGVDDPTPVLFPCVPAGLDIVKTAVRGPNGTCPRFADGVVGEGAPLELNVGDTATYCISVSNPEAGIAGDVLVTDAQAPDDFVIGTLSGGQSATVSYNLTVDLTTPEINTATATATSGAGDLGPVSDTAAIVVAPLPEPELEIVKTVLPGANAPCPLFAGGVLGPGDVLPVTDGSTVTYCVAVRNVGLGAATDVVISDEQGPGDFVVGSLASEAETSVAYEVVVSLSTPSTNTAVVRGAGPNGALDPVQDTARIAVGLLPEPELQIVKTVLRGPAATCPSFDDGTPGRGAPLLVDDQDVVTYCIAVRNVGDGPATDVGLSDAQAPAATDLAVGDLAPGADATRSFDLQVSAQTPTLNTALADGQGPYGPVQQVADVAAISVRALQPNLEIVKTVLPGPNASCPNFDGGTPGPGEPLAVVDGSTVTYCVSVRNSGAGRADDVDIADEQGPGDFLIGELASGEEASVRYDVMVTLATPTTNTAITRGQAPDGSELDPVEDQAAIVVTPLPEPELQIVKTAQLGPNTLCPNFDGGTPGQGAAVPLVETQQVTYCISVRNVGDGAATGVVITDDQAPNTFDLTVGDLAPGQEATRTFDIEVSLQTESINTAFADGQGPYGPVRQVSDDAIIDVQRQADPALQIVKTVINGPNGACPAFSDGVVGDGDPLPVTHGEIVTYCISVTNAGAGDATSVNVVDLQAPGVYVLGPLAAGQSLTRSYDIVVNAQTVERNTATASGRGPNGTLPEVSDTALIDPSPQPDPQLNIVKTVVRGPGGTCPNYDDGIAGVGEALKVELGDIVTYCISIRNTGEATASNIVIADGQAPNSPYLVDDLAPGESADRSYDLTVASDTPSINVATVNGEGPNGDLPEGEDDAQINAANIRLTHTVTRLDRTCDDTVRDVDNLVVHLEGLDVRWCYRITNTGSVPLTNLRLSSLEVGFADLDALALAGRSFIIDDDGEAQPLDLGAADNVQRADAALVVLMPEQTITLEVPALIPGGGLESFAVVTADPADVDGNVLGLDPVDDADEAEVQEASIQLEKRVALGANTDCAFATEVVVMPAGSPVTWCFEVTNIGTLTLRVTQITDPTLDLVVLVPDTLQEIAPEGSFTLSVSGPAPGAIINVASVEGVALDDAGAPIEQAPVVRDSDDAQIRLPVADMAITKSVSDQGPVPVGTTLTYTLVVSNNGPDPASDVTVADELPIGLTYLALPGTDGWACALTNGGQGFDCARAGELASGAGEELIYTVQVDTDAALNTDFVNTATVSAVTEDPDLTNNTDIDLTRTDPPDEVDPVVERPEYPGPFDQSDPPETPVEPDEVLGLAITGSSAGLLALLSLLMLAMGGTFTVGARRSNKEVDQ